MNDPHDVFFDYHSSQNDNYLMSSPIPCQNFQEVSLGSPTSNNNSKRVKSMFTKKEDTKLIKLVKEYGSEDWALISSFFKDRTRRQCRERWNKYLCPSLNHSPWTPEEDELLINKYNQIGPKWSLISKSFKNRTDINIKSRYIYLMRKIRKNKNSFDNNQKNNIQQFQTIKNNYSNKIAMFTSSLNNTRIPSIQILFNQPSFSELSSVNYQMLLNNRLNSINKNIYRKNCKSGKRKQSSALKNQSLESNIKNEMTNKSSFLCDNEFSNFTFENLEKYVEDCYDEIFEDNIFYDF